MKTGYDAKSSHDGGIIPNHSLGNDFALCLPATVKPILLVKQVGQVSV